jgi:UDP-N-acetylmuramoylalanine--D-glutamate ligase
MSLRGKTVLVLGMGETGFSMAKWLSRMGASVRLTDTREAPPYLEALKQALPDAVLSTGKFLPEAFFGIDMGRARPW